MKTLIFPAAVLLLLQACQQATMPVKERPVQIDTMQLIAPPANSVKVASNEVSVVSHDSTTYVRFGDCYFSLDWVIPDQKRNDFERHPDTLYFRLEHGRSIEGQMLAVTTGETDRVKVYQRYETSAVIGKEPLLRWKHYLSPWEALPPEANNFFVCKKYSAEERGLFPAISVQVLQQYTKQHAAPSVHSKIAHLESFPAPPVRIEISRYYIRLDGLHRQTPEKINKLLVIDVTFKG
jgi:hypothetical protein